MFIMKGKEMAKHSVDIPLLLFWRHDIIEQNRIAHRMRGSFEERRRG